MKKLLGLTLLALLLLSAVVLWRGLQFGLEPEPLETATSLEWDEHRALASISAAIQIPTVSRGADIPVDTEAFADFHAFLTQRYPLVFSQLEVEVLAGQSLLLHWQGSGEQLPVMFLAHQDVVPVTVGSESEWTHPPFAGVVADGFIWGRGALDDKGSLISLLEAAERLLAEGFVPERSIYFGFGHDEEVGGQGAKAMAKVLADRRVRLGFLLDEGGFVTKGLIPGVDGRVALIGPAEKGYTSLKISAQGLGGHASMPPRHTALGLVARAINRLENHPFPADLSFTRDTLMALGSAAPFVQRVVFANLWLFGPLAEAMLSAMPATSAGIRTSTAATMMTAGVKDNVLPQRAEAVVNFRILPGDTVDSVIHYVTTVIDDPEVTVSLYSDFSNNPSAVAPLDAPGFKLLSRLIREVRPDTLVAPRIVVGATDARHFEAISDASYRFLGLEVGPEELAGMHGTDERVSTASFIDSARLYYLLIRRSAEL
ncbi:MULTISPECIES: M20 family peptidase [Zhongshania]|jgi:carboxypeptidase PM20D1|uniref:Carboxypeptidase PM20D1 n=1 Tax=Zhongshania antarctica TaxID=641702 RepID=A0A840R9K3_9GAMM|nr:MULTISPECIES: M20 family peptidase [Zhongshania]MBB5189136.1 carboxypeptidase PM20D1 [Zhongshania antarctica]